MKSMTLAEPQTGATLLRKNPVKDGDVLNIRHSG
jgi:hypothetical protein